MEDARKAFLENEEWQNTFDDPDLKAMATGALRACVCLSEACIPGLTLPDRFLSRSFTPDPDKWREVMMQNAKLLYATADDQKEEL